MLGPLKGGSRAFRFHILAPDAGAGRGPFPVVVFSHGFTALPKDYSGLLDALAACGYVVLAAEHPDSGGIIASSVPRPDDIGFIVGNLGRILEDVPLTKGRADLASVAVAGHSLGAFSALSAVGQATFALAPLLAASVARDLPPGSTARASKPLPDVKCAVALSPLGLETLGLGPNSWNAIVPPVLTLSGNLDGDLGSEGDLKRPFDAMEKAGLKDKLHVSFKDFGHFTLADVDKPKPVDWPFPVWFPPATRRDTALPAALEFIAAFLDAHLKNRDDALKWLASVAGQTVTRPAPAPGQRAEQAQVRATPTG